MTVGVQQSGNGVGIGFILFLTFMVLKLCGQIDWSWWWVTAPLWGPACVFVAAGMLIGIGKAFEGRR